LQIPLYHDDPRDVPYLRAACDAAVADFARKLPEMPGLTVGSAFGLVHQLNLLADSAFSNQAHLLRAFPFLLGPAYGRFDPARCDVLWRGVFQHIVALCDHVLERERPLQGAPAAASLRGLLDLARLRCMAQLRLRTAERAAHALIALEQSLGPMGQGHIRLLRERCCLDRGDVGSARDLRRSMEHDADAEVLPMHDWEAWLSLASTRPTGLVDDPPVEGWFESVHPTGEVLRHPHATLPVRLALAQLRSVRLRQSHVLIDQRGGILLPHPWHLAMGDYPYSYVDVLNRGARGAVLRAACDEERVEEPVLVLANMDATWHRNFYHWIVLTLTRINLLDEFGFLRQRRLLLPDELSSWMRSSLLDIGLIEDRFIPYGQGQNLELADALVLSPLEFASPALVERLRCRLWRAAGLDPAAPPARERLLYISRQSANRRPLAQEEEMETMARSLGFDVVAPETLPLLDQVRLFASTRGVAGPPGAAFTNLIWMQSGTRVLSIFKEETTLPTFVDLSLTRGQQHRWLLGRNLPGFEFSVLNAPFRVDLALVRRELRWVSGGE
jgi:capsular polysaccharide biosynthesis protein